MPQQPCLASFNCVKLNVSDLQTDMFHWHLKPRQKLPGECNTTVAAACHEQQSLERALCGLLHCSVY